MIRFISVQVLLIAAILLKAAGSLSATVINFDDLDQGAVVPNNYAGLTWGTSTLSRPYADFTSFVVNGNMDYSTPHSSPNFILNGYGVPDLWFEFPSPANFCGAWLAAPKIERFPAQKVRFADDLGQTSVWLELTDTPQYLAANFSGSRKIYVQPAGVYPGGSGGLTDGGWYTMDDIAYEYASDPVEVAGTVPTFYASLGNAYAQLSEGELATILAQAVELREDVDLTRNVSLTLLGGYDPCFNIYNGYTTLHGSISISYGSVIIDGLIVE